MRIWDIPAGYLNRQSLLGEHRELHGILSIIANNKKGYSNHPETLRWVGFHWALNRRHDLLSSEMKLRGYNEKTPSTLKDCNDGLWTTSYIDEPFQQFDILKEKYLDKEYGRIKLPSNKQELWRQFKYSIMARNIKMYQAIGQELANKNTVLSFEHLANILEQEIRKVPTKGAIRNTLEHMWGYVSKYSSIDKAKIINLPEKELLKEIQKLVMAVEEPYLMESTALSELEVWL